MQQCKIITHQTKTRNLFWEWSYMGIATWSYPTKPMKCLHMYLWIKMAATPASVIPLPSAKLVTLMENSRWIFGTYKYKYITGGHTHHLSAHTPSPLWRWCRKHWHRQLPLATPRTEPGIRLTRKTARTGRWRHRRRKQSWPPMHKVQQFAQKILKWVNNRWLHHSTIYMVWPQNKTFTVNFRLHGWQCLCVYMHNWNLVPV